MNNPISLTNFKREQKYLSFHFLCFSIKNLIKVKDMNILYFFKFHLFISKLTLKVNKIMMSDDSTTAMVCVSRRLNND